jgi:hypothetical protein
MFNPIKIVVTSGRWKLLNDIVILVEKEVCHYWKYGYQQYNAYPFNMRQHCRVAQSVSVWTSELQVA